MGAKQRHIARLGEYHELRRFGAAGPYERVADIPVDAASVCHDKALPSFDDDPKPFQEIARNPGVLAPGVYERVGQGPRRPAPVQILDLYRGAKQSHVVQGSTFLTER